MPQEHQPGDPAPVSGYYRQVNIFGSATYVLVHARQGDPLPAAPRGFGWHLESEVDGEED